MIGRVAHINQHRHRRPCAGEWLPGARELPDLRRLFAFDLPRSSREWKAHSALASLGSVGPPLTL